MFMIHISYISQRLLLVHDVVFPLVLPVYDYVFYQVKVCFLDYFRYLSSLHVLGASEKLGMQNCADVS